MGGHRLETPVRKPGSWPPFPWGSAHLADLSGSRVTRQFEEAFADEVGAGYAVATSSGTLALISGLAACGVGPGHEVIVSPYGWGGTVAAVLALGAVPVFADIEPAGFGLDPDSVRNLITSDTRAVLATHMFGIPAMLDELGRVAADHGLRLVLDAAQALGALYGGRPMGAFGDVAAFSFGWGKVLTTGEGGMATTRDPGIYERLILASQHPIRSNLEVGDPSLTLLVDEISLSCRIHPVAAAIGLSRLRELPGAIARRRRRCRAIAEALSGIHCLDAPREPEGVGFAFHRFPLTWRNAAAGVMDRSSAVERFQAAGVPIVAGPVHVPIHRRFRFSGKGQAEGPLSPRSWRAGPTPVAAGRCRQELLLELDWDSDGAEDPETLSLIRESCVPRASGGHGA